MRTNLGSHTHLTGDGGDSVLFQPPLHLADLIRHRRWKRAANEACGWARLRHHKVLPFLVDATRAARASRRQALANLARTVGTPGRNDHGRVRWFPLLPFPAWAEPTARRLLAQAAREAVDAPDTLPGLDSSVRVLVDEIREVARTAAADAELAASCGINLHNPFLDATVMDSVLRTPIDQRAPLHDYKPQLSQAMAGLLPPAVAARTTKGSFDADHYAGLRANLPDLRALTDGHLMRPRIDQPDFPESRPARGRRRHPDATGHPRTSLGRRSLAGRPPPRPRTCLDERARQEQTLIEPSRSATAPAHVRALDFGHVTVLVNYRNGHVQCLLSAAAALWRDTAATGRLDVMPSVLATRLLTTGLLVRTLTPIPW